MPMHGPLRHPSARGDVNARVHRDLGREADAALGAMDAGVAPHLWKVTGQRVVFAVIDLPDPESLDRALAGLPIVQELGGGARTRRIRSTTTGPLPPT